MSRIDFVLPIDDRKNVVAALLRAIPEHWDCMNGKLHTTKDVDKSKIDPSATTFTILHWKATWRSDTDMGDLDPYRAFSNDQLPSELDFVTAGKHGSLYDLARCKRLALYYVQLGYTGHLVAVPSDGRRPPQVGLQLFLDEWEDPGPQWYYDVFPGARPPTARLFYDDRRNANLSLLRPFLETCRKLKLMPLPQ